MDKSTHDAFATVLKHLAIIEASLPMLAKQGIKIMTALDDAVAKIAADVKSNSDEIKAAIVALAAAVAAGDPAKTAAAVATLQAASADLESSTASLTTAVTPPTP
jgi:hypothetical protein